MKMEIRLDGIDDNVVSKWEAAEKIGSEKLEVRIQEALEALENCEYHSEWMDGMIINFTD